MDGAYLAPGNLRRSTRKDRSGRSGYGLSARRGAEQSRQPLVRIDFAMEGGERGRWIYSDGSHWLPFSVRRFYTPPTRPGPRRPPPAASVQSRRVDLPCPPVRRLTIHQPCRIVALWGHMWRKGVILNYWYVQIENSKSDTIVFFGKKKEKK